MIFSFLVYIIANISSIIVKFKVGIDSE
ncbi:uncharacterized protein METZ01_LOCUS114195 [marine metagenome]|uniref:Uncharacterized protein n=1 Tax=marine metagenome TaxID=408172 RepID=A0A381XA32_9ZZZZ